MLQNNNNIKSYIDKLWNSFWSGGIANPLTAIEQITYLIFMKRLDDIEAKRERDAEFTRDKYKSKFYGKFIPPGMTKENAVDKKELRWNVFKHYPADTLLLHIQTKVFPFLKELNGTTSPFTKHMANAVFIMPKASLLVEAIKTIDALFLEIEKDASDGGHSFQDIQGDVYEVLLSEIASAGKNGQFRTPRHIIKLMAELVEPQLGQRIADPACGTSGFLLGAYQYMLTQMVLKENPDAVLPDEDGFYRATLSAMLNEKVKSIIEDCLFGFDVDTTMVRLGLMNLMMHGIDEPKIDYKDTLSKTYKEEGLYQLVMANPPFTGNIDKGDINEDLKLPTTKTELLFVERIYTMLAMGGTGAVIVPSGVIQNSGKAFEALRKLLIEQTELKVVIALPSGVFKPYAGVSTAILIFTKGGETNNVWFYDCKADGYTLDDKRNKIAETDLPDIVEQYRKRKTKKETDRKAKCFFVPKAEILTNNYDLNLSTYKEEVYEEVVYEKPEAIMSKLESLEMDIQKGLKELKGLM
jgi:type I restriction enzyme M protein